MHFKCIINSLQIHFKFMIVQHFNLLITTLMPIIIQFLLHFSFSTQIEFYPFTKKVLLAAKQSPLFTAFSLNAMVFTTLKALPSVNGNLLTIEGNFLALRALRCCDTDNTVVNKIQDFLPCCLGQANTC